MTAPRIVQEEVHHSLSKITTAEPDGRDPKAVNGQNPRYLNQGAPCCLVARILVDLGFSVRVLKDLDRAGPVSLKHEKHPLRKRFTPHAWALLVYLQKCNDLGLTWKEAETAAFPPTDPHRLHPYARARFWAKHPWLAPQSQEEKK